MAVRRTGVQKTRNSGRKSSEKNDRVPVSMIFWVFFFIVLITAFFALLPKVKKGVNIPPKNITTEQPSPEKPPVDKPPVSGQSAQPEKPPADKPPATPAKETTKETPKEKTAPEKPPVEKPPVDKPPGTASSPPKAQQSASQPPASQPPANQPPANQPTAAKPEEKPAETRDRSIYFMRDGGADLLLTKVSRKIKVSDSPLFDCLNALLAGPTAEEKNRGLVNFVPPGTQLISAQVRQNTAYLNFNEEFRYNTLGREGCAAQLKQIVWTATEFPNVQDVQIQIEGQTVDFLMEGILIRNPIRR